MDALHVGILVSRDLQRQSLDTSGCDLTSGVEVAEALSLLGHRPRMLYADEHLDLALRAQPVDAAFVCLHGNRGGEGHIQAALELRQIPFVGPDATSTALAYDKARCRRTLAFHNIPVPTTVDLTPDEVPDSDALAVLGWPCVIKPRRGAHGVGVQRVETPRDVRHAVDGALAISEHLLVERALPGRELQVIIVDGEVLGMADVDRDTGSFAYPSSMSMGRRDGIARLALRAAGVLGLDRHICRVDVIADPAGNEWVLEVEPLPPLHRDGSLQRMLKAEGLRFPDLIATLLGRVRPRPGAPARPAGATGMELPLH